MQIMPDRQAVFQLGLLLLAVPAQYLIMRYVSNSDGQRTMAIKDMFKSAALYKDQYLSWDKWQKWCIELVDNIKNLKYPAGSSTPEGGGAEDTGESPAVEVLKFRDPEGWFAGSPEPRSPRPAAIKYRIGQVIRHKIWGYRGIIIGWDPEAKAPEEWLEEMHPDDKPQWRRMPNYSILVDTRDRMVPQRTYVPEENIEIVTNTRVIHPDVDDYFEGFDGAQYLPRPSLQNLYPHD